MNIDELIIKKFNIVNGDGPPFISKDGTRETLAAFMNDMGYRSGAEIGVRKGEYSERLCRHMRGLKLKSVDPWIPFRKNGKDRQESRYQFSCSVLEPYGVEIIRKTSVEAAREVEDNSLDFVYIDAMHEFDLVMMDILTWVPKVRRGGIVSGHDYTPPTIFCGVMAAVDVYTKVHDIKQWYITNGISKCEHNAPSWFWVKS